MQFSSYLWLPGSEWRKTKHMTLILGWIGRKAMQTQMHTFALIHIQQMHSLKKSLAEPAGKDTKIADGRYWSFASKREGLRSPPFPSAWPPYAAHKRHAKLA